MRRLISAMLLVLLVSVVYATAPQLQIVEISGQEQQQALASIGKISIAEGKVQLMSHSDILIGERDYNKVRKIVFAGLKKTGAALSEVEDKAAIAVYPNPTAEKLFVEGLQDGQTVRVFSLDGQLLRSAKTLDNRAEIDVEALPMGVYLLQVETDILKFIKNNN